MKRLTLLGLFLAVGCSSSPSTNSGDGTPTWTDVQVQAIHLWNRQIGGGLEVSSSPDHRFENAHKVVFSKKNMIVSEFYVMAWQSLWKAPGVSITITEDSMVFGGRALRIANPSIDIVNQAVHKKRFEKRMSGGVGTLPDSLKVERSEKKLNYTRLYVKSLDPNLPHTDLTSIAPGRMIWITAHTSTPTERFVMQRAVVLSKPIEGEQRPAPEIDLGSERRAMDRRLRILFSAAADRALKDSQADVRTIHADTLPELKKAIFSYTGHTGPATAAGGAAFDRAKEKLARTLGFDLYAQANEDPMPELLPISVGGNRFIRPPDLPADFVGMHRALVAAKEKAKKSPGRWYPGNVALGADEQEYEPSDEELVCAFIGDALASKVKGMSAAEKAIAAKTVNGSIPYTRYGSREVKVMGSGLFTYWTVEKQSIPLAP